MRSLFSIIIILLLLLSCGGKTPHPLEDWTLDSLVNANPDSALVILNAECGARDSWDAERYRLELLRAKAMNKAYVLFDTASLAVVQRVADYYRRKGTDNERMLSLYVLGCAYRDLGSAPRAIETWQLAVEQADTSRADCDLSTLMRIHSQMNELYTRIRLPELANEEAKQAGELCWKMGDTLNALIFEEKKCGLLFRDGKYEECIKATEQLYQQYLQYGYKDEAALSGVYIVKSYLALGNYEEAKHYLDIYGSYCLAHTDHRKIDGGFAPCYIYKGNYYLGIGKVDSAEYCYRQAIPEIRVLDNALLVYKGLYKIYGMYNKMDSVMKYMSLYSDTKEKVYHGANSQAAIEAKNLYDYSIEQRIAKEKTRKISHLKDIGYASLLILAVILSVLSTLYYRERTHARRLLTQLNSKEKKLEQANQGLMELYSQERKLKDHLKEARKQHKEEVKEIASQLSAITEEKEELFRSAQVLRGQIDMLRTEKHIIEMGSKAQTLEHTEIVRQIEKILKNPIAYHMSASDWKELVDTVNKTHPEFYNRMNHYQSLTKEEYRVCLLTLIGCSSKDINTLMDKSSAYASNCKKRLHLMVFNQPGTAKEFVSKIRTFM